MEEIRNSPDDKRQGKDQMLKQLSVAIQKIHQRVKISTDINSLMNQKMQNKEESMNIQQEMNKKIMQIKNIYFDL
jgi:hypothetical protein